MGNVVRLGLICLIVSLLAAPAMAQPAAPAAGVTSAPGPMNLGAAVGAGLVILGAGLGIGRDLVESQEYRQFVRVHLQLMEMAGTPPFNVALGDHSDDALSFEELRRKVLDAAQRGVALQRFKGLGEMNPDQLEETTMAPGSRTLAQVTMEDAAGADELFSMLMGDVVEPRRRFIEDNALQATVDI